MVAVVVVVVVSGSSNNNMLTMSNWPTVQFIIHTFKRKPAIG